MKLSELVAYRTLIENVTPVDIEEVTKKMLGPSLHYIQSSSLQIPDKTGVLESKYSAVNESIYSYLSTVDEIKQHVYQLILDQEPYYLSESYKLYESMVNDSPDHILNRRFSAAESINEFIRERVQIYSDWKHAGMAIRPGLESWIHGMVASDPLYILDTDYDLLRPAKEKFNDRYAQRVRWNVIPESFDHALLDSVPDGQIGLCVCYNFFHFKPFEIMKKYLEEIFYKLKPGGIVAMTFNDCDRSGAVSNAERYFMCYTPGRMVKGLCESIGFEMEYSKDLDAAATWLELKKPGILTSLRGGQTLATTNSKLG